MPDRLPYGLDRLGSYGYQVTAAPPYAAGPVGRHAARAARALGRYEWAETWRKAELQGSADLCVCWDERAGLPSILRGGVPVATGVIALTDRDRTHRRLAAPLLRRAHRVWALSSAQLPVLHDELGVPEHRLRHLLFGIDGEFFTLGDDEPVPGLVASAGNDRDRDHHTVVRAMCLVRQSIGHARFKIATQHDVPVPAELGVRHPHLSHPQLRELYWRSQVVVVALRPNVHVSGMTVALEAMACGRPIVITATPGMSDYVSSEWGVLVPPGDADALAAAIIRLLRDPAEATALGAAGHKAVQEQFTTERQAQRLAELLRD
ncbi:glycosyltransferase family 4 protein [Micromonospora sp. NBC_00389]|uniref:glycosyltransferase family 4 protein n=1 Tax=Micromonospora sp. NBC_00389 TaxID=2903586 RepID=UPI002E1B42B4